MRFWLLPFFFLVGCQSDNSYEMVRDKASQDLRCPRNNIEVRYQGSLTSSCPMLDQACRDREETAVLLIAQGCGASRVYRCDSHRDTTFGETHTTCAASTFVQQM
ncbi:MAG: hypothetical protein ACXWUG_09705 [Polyangiales bacterium]